MCVICYKLGYKIEWVFLLFIYYCFENVVSSLDLCNLECYIDFIMILRKNLKRLVMESECK